MRVNKGETVALEGQEGGRQDTERKESEAGSSLLGSHHFDFTLL